MANENLVYQAAEKYYRAYEISEDSALAIAAFFIAESGLLEEKLTPFQNKHQKLDEITSRAIENSILAPIKYTFLQRAYLPYIEDAVKEGRKTTSMAGLLGIASIANLQRHTSPANIRMAQATGAYKKLFEEKEKRWKEILEQAKKYSGEYPEAMEELMRRIADECRRAILGPDGLPAKVKNEDFRNSMYRESLDRRAYLLGHCTEVLTRMDMQIVYDLIIKKRVFDSLTEEQKKATEGRELRIAVMGIGKGKADGREFFENLPDPGPIEIYKAFEKAVKQHFEERRAEIFSAE